MQDAHGNEPWWFADMTTGFRTVFLAREPTWEGWLDALRHNRVVAVRRDAVSGFRTWMHGGSPEVVDFVRRRDRDWRWWDNPEIRRPLVSLVAVTPGDEFEAARPDRGVTIRVRCAWENTAQGLPRQPIAELVKLTVDGSDASPTLVAKESDRPARASKTTTTSSTWPTPRPASTRPRRSCGRSRRARSRAGRSSSSPEPGQARKNSTSARIAPKYASGMTRRIFRWSARAASAPSLRQVRWTFVTRSIPISMKRKLVTA